MYAICLLSLCTGNLFPSVFGKTMMCTVDFYELLRIYIKGEVYPKIKFSPVVVFGVLSRMVLVRGS